ncbi:MAG: VCBS repeat-containing protein [Acidobacteria bacterium]|nr:VCBS repeat-containing protein [Acidobacteriota bacterium]
MGKRVILGAALFVAAILGALLSRGRFWQPSEETTQEGPAKQRVREFWRLFNEANQRRMEGNFTPAVALYRECLKLNSVHEDSLYYLGASLEEIGEYVEASAAYHKLTEVNPSSGRGFSQLGQVLSVQAPGAPVNLDEARRAYERAIQINSEQSGGFLRLGLLDLDQGRSSEALKSFQVAAKFGSPEGIFLAGYTELLQNHPREAMPSFRRVLEAYERERRVAARGVLSEGDVLPALGKPLTALERAAIQSMLYLYWTVAPGGGYPPGVPRVFQVHDRPELSADWKPADSQLGTRSGGRAAWADFDRDGRVDLVVVGAGQPVRLYQNREDGFVDVTRTAGLGGARDAWDAVWGDYDGDGFPDLYLVRSGFLGSGQNQLFHNNGNGAFTDVTTATGLHEVRSTARALFVDLDGDGRPELVEAGASSAESGPLRVYRYEGKQWRDKTAEWGLAARGTAVDCAAADYDRDGKTDLFVLFWQKEVALFRNQGKGHFVNSTEQAGLKGVHGQGFSSLFFDYDKDGLPDLLLASYAAPPDAASSYLQPDFRSRRHTPRLFRNRGAGRFEEVTDKAGLLRSYGTVQALAVDVNGDGWPDLVFANGSLDSRRLEPSVILENRQGKEFGEAAYLPSFDRPGNFIGVSAADLNQDEKPALYFATNPIFRQSRFSGGLFLKPSVVKKTGAKDCR